MNITELIIKLQKIEAEGYGNKNIYIDGGGCYTQDDYHIDSIQKNTHPDIEPNYFFLMAGKAVEEQ